MRILLAFALLLLATASPAWADYAAGHAAFQRGDYAQALREWKPLAENGDPRAQYGLALLYERGLGMDHPHLSEALHWYRQAARQGLQAAQNNLAMMYAQGRGVDAEPAVAVDLWQSAARAGHAPSQYNLGLAYARGFGVKQNAQEAAHWYGEAARQGLADAQLALADAYREGRGVAKDPAQAEHWMREAARSGSAAAARRLAAVAPPAPDSQTLPGKTPRLPEEAAPEQGGYAVQLSANRSRESAAHGVEILEKRYHAELEGLALRVHRVDLGSPAGVWYRVVSRALRDRAAAQALCDRIRARNGRAACLVVQEQASPSPAPPPGVAPGVGRPFRPQPSGTAEGSRAE